MALRIRNGNERVANCGKEMKMEDYISREFEYFIVMDEIWGEDLVNQMFKLYSDAWDECEQFCEDSGERI